MLLAAGVVTWMLFWMRRTSANIKGELHAGVDRALIEGGIFGLAVLAFTAVIREGIETALFLMGQATAAGTEALSTLVGARCRPRDRGRSSATACTAGARPEPAQRSSSGRASR